MKVALDDVGEYVAYLVGSVELNVVGGFSFLGAYVVLGDLYGTHSGSSAENADLDLIDLSFVIVSASASRKGKNGCENKQ